MFAQVKNTCLPTRQACAIGVKNLVSFYISICNINDIYKNGIYLYVNVNK
jgi:hypothetical protein